MIEQENQSLTDLASALDSKKEVNNLMATLELIWQGINLYYGKRAKNQSISPEDLQVLKTTMNKLNKDVGPILETE